MKDSYNEDIVIRIDRGDIRITIEDVFDGTHPERKPSYDTVLSPEKAKELITAIQKLLLEMA
jgi:hypothetical protein